MSHPATGSHATSRALGRYYVVTKNPSDYPGAIVVRGWTILRHQLDATGLGSGGAVPDRDPEIIVHFDKHSPAYPLPVALDKARERIRVVAPGLCRVERLADDDPVIVETWL